MFLLLVRLTQLWAFSNGPPLSTCESMGPHHANFTAQSGPSPYSITVSNNTYTPGDNLTVTISGSKTFKGFILQAQGSNSSVAWPVGEFTQVPDGNCKITISNNFICYYCLFCNFFVWPSHDTLQLTANKRDSSRNVMTFCYLNEFALT